MERRSPMSFQRLATKVFPRKAAPQSVATNHTCESSCITIIMARPISALSAKRFAETVKSKRLSFRIMYSKNSLFQRYVQGQAIQIYFPAGTLLSMKSVIWPQLPPAFVESDLLKRVVNVPWKCAGLSHRMFPPQPSSKHGCG